MRPAVPPLVRKRRRRVASRPFRRPAPRRRLRLAAGAAAGVRPGGVWGGAALRPGAGRAGYGRAAGRGAVAATLGVRRALLADLPGYGAASGPPVRPSRAPGGPGGVAGAGEPSRRGASAGA